MSRFPDAKQARAYLGLVPTEYSSGERRQRGRINKAGPNRARYLLVEAAWSILRRRSAATADLYQWATAIRGRRGTKIAVLALARKLAGILYAMWRDECDFKPASLTEPAVAA